MSSYVCPLCGLGYAVNTINAGRCGDTSIPGHGHGCEGVLVPSSEAASRQGLQGRVQTLDDYLHVLSMKTDRLQTELQESVHECHRIEHELSGVLLHLNGHRSH